MEARIDRLAFPSKAGLECLPPAGAVETLFFWDKCLARCGCDCKIAVCCGNDGALPSREVGRDSAIKTVVAVLWRVVVASWLVVLPQLQAEERKMDIDYGASSIEVAGMAWGFIPADLAFRRFEAEIGVDLADESVAAADFRFRYPDLTTGRSNRDQKIHDWLEAETFPEGSFALERVEREGDRTVAVGQLLLHGVRREARFEVSLERRGERVRLKAVAKIDYRQWGLPTLRVLVFSIDPTLEIRIDVSGEVDADGIH